MCPKAFVRIQIYARRTQRDNTRLDIIRVIAEILPNNTIRILAQLGVNSRERRISAGHGVAEYEKVVRAGIRIPV